MRRKQILIGLFALIIDRTIGEPKSLQGGRQRAFVTMCFFRAVTGSTGISGVVFARAVTGGTGANGLINCGFNLAPQSLQQSYHRERHVMSVRVQDCNLDLSSAHVFTAKFLFLGKIVPHGQRLAFRNKYIVFAFFI